MNLKTPVAAGLSAAAVLSTISYTRSRRKLPTLRSTERTLSLEKQIRWIIETEAEGSGVSTGGLRVGICAIHIPSGEVVRVNDKDVMPLASVFKVPILVEAALKLQEFWPLGPDSCNLSSCQGAHSWDDGQNKLTPTTHLRVDEDCKCIGSGELFNSPVGTSVPLDECCALMMKISDNTATDMVLRVVGGPERLYTRCKNFFGEESIATLNTLVSIINFLVGGLCINYYLMWFWF
eukprot:2484465-Pyramimonas_sp.AAC.6